MRTKKVVNPLKGDFSLRNQGLFILKDKIVSNLQVRTYISDCQIRHVIHYEGSYFDIEMKPYTEETFDANQIVGMWILPSENV